MTTGCPGFRGGPDVDTHRLCVPTDTSDSLSQVSQGFLERRTITPNSSCTSILKINPGTPQSLSVLLCFVSCLTSYNQLIACSSIYLRMVSNSVLPVETRYRICVKSVTLRFRSNSCLAYVRISCRVSDEGIRLVALTISRHRAMTR